MIAEARRLGMDVLVEAHDESEVARAVALGARIIGINNRDLRTLQVDLGTTERLAPLVPADRLVVAESGISGRADIERLAPYADAFLVGCALMRAERPAEAARALAFGRVKICGLTNAADLDMGARAGATHAGFVMVPGTPRAVSPAAAEAILAGAGTQARIVGIFRNEDPRIVDAAARRLGLHAVQLHGNEEVGAVRALLPAETEIWAAAQIGAGVADPRTGADRILFDSGPGGTGRTFDWSRVAGRADLGSGLLAGGLDPANARAAARLGAWALDVGSGLEAVPRWKDSNRVAAFFAALRPAVRGGSRLHADARPVRRLWRRLCAGNPDAGARAARGGLRRRADGRGVPGRAGRLARRLCRAADAADALPQSRRRQGAHLSEARGSAPRRRAQDQPGAGPGAARPADGQDPADRRNRRRPAWRRHRDGRRPVRAGDAHLHGRRGRRPAAAERLPDAADGRRGGAGEERPAGPQGRDQRGAARLDGELRDHPLSARHRRRPASLPADGARISARDRAGGAGADPGRGRAAARCGDRLRRRGLQRDRACSPTSSTTKACG